MALSLHTDVCTRSNQCKLLSAALVAFIHSFVVDFFLPLNTLNVTRKISSIAYFAFQFQRIITFCELNAVTCCRWVTLKWNVIQEIKCIIWNVVSERTNERLNERWNLCSYRIDDIVGVFIPNNSIISFCHFIFFFVESLSRAHFDRHEERASEWEWNDITFQCSFDASLWLR